MGLLGMFAKKAAINLVRAGAQKNASEASRFDELAKTAKSTSLSKEEVAINTILENTKGGVRNSVQITYPEKGFEVTLMEVKTLLSDSRTKDPFTVEIRLFIAMPNAESLLAEHYDSIGESINEAVVNAAKKFSAVLQSMFDIIDSDDDGIIENRFDGDIHIYRYGGDRFVSSVGDSKIQELGDLFPVVSGELAGFLGAKKYYWLSMELIFEGDKVVSKCLINNEKINRLSELIAEKAEPVFSQGMYGQYQQQMLIVQSGRTYVQRRQNYNKAYNDMYKFVRETIPLIGNSSVLVSYDELFGKVEAITGNRLSAWEVMTFLPEIYVQKYFNIKGTGLVAMTKGEDTFALTEFQISPIRVIKSEVESFLEKNKPSDEFNQNIFSLSARFTAAMNALNSGVKEEELAFGVLSCKAPDDYDIW